METAQKVRELVQEKLVAHLASLREAKHCKSVGVNVHGGIAMTIAVDFRPLVLGT